MKIRKLLPLLLLAAGAILALSSCDALLDAIYPNNIINVTAHISPLDAGAHNYSSYVVVTVGGNIAAASQSAYFSGYLDGSNNGLYYLPSFSHLKDGVYDITATFYGWTGSVYVVYSSGLYTISMPYAGSNTAAVDIVF